MRGRPLRNAANFGWGGDTTQNIRWRLENGELDGVNPKVIVLQAGTNNVGADQPVPRTDENSRLAHAQLLEKARGGIIGVYFAGDSITRRWGATDYPDLLAHWRQTFFVWGGVAWSATPSSTPAITMANEGYASFPGLHSNSQRQVDHEESETDALHR